MVINDAKQFKPLDEHLLIDNTRKTNLTKK